MNIIFSFIILGIIIIFSYCSMIYVFLVGWNKTIKKQEKKQGKQQKNELPFISVVIAFRNEKDNLPNLLTALNNQSYPKEMYEIIAVDDNSSDNFETNIIKESFKNLKILKSIGEGKKLSLKTGIMQSQGQLIVTTDADCIPHSLYLQTIADDYCESNASMLSGPVKMLGNNSLLSRFQTLEHTALQICGACAIFLNNPIYCSGANLAFTKKDWSELINETEGIKNLSGDDVFLLHIFKKFKKKIVFVKNKNAIVHTKTENTIADFLKQRMRWGGKSLQYNDFTSILVATIVFSSNFFISISLISLFFLPNIYFPTLFGLKMTADYILLKKGNNFFDVKMPFYDYIIFSLIYPFYISIAAFGAIFTNVSWKGRKIRN